jgi:uncharacterized protein
MNDDLDGAVSIVFTKWGDRPHWQFECRRLGEDAFGTWLAGPPGTVLRLPNREPVVEKHGFAQLVPHRGDWTAFFNVSGPFELYVDVTSAPVWSGGTMTCVDLDLDVIRRPDGRVELLDEDEFLDHQVRLAYPVEVIERARATADWLLEAVAARREPFGSVGAAWLATQPWAARPR